MKPRLILHVGMHKTASSSLQEVMEVDRAALARAGFLYAATNRAPFAHLPKHTSLYEALRQGPEAFAAERAVLEAEFDASGCHTMVLSEEGLSSPHALGFGAIAGFAERFEIDVVVYLRRPDRFAESLWNQYSREGSQREGIEPFLATPRLRRHLQFVQILEMWEAVGRLMAFSYEAACREGSIVAHFAGVTGVPLPDVDPRSNVSPSMACAAVMTEVNKQIRGGLRPEDWGALEARFDLGGRKLALGGRLRRQLLAEMAPQMEEIARRHHVAFPEALPEEPEEPIPDPDPEVVAWLLEHLRARRGRA